MNPYFANLAKIIAEKSEFNLILMSEDAEVISAAVETAGFKCPLIYAATEATADAFGKIALDNDLPLAVKSDSIDGVIALTDKLVAMGVKDLVIDSGSRELKQSLEDLVALRRSALKDSNRSVGFAR